MIALDINELKVNWDQLGRLDAFGNIITDPERKGKWSKEDFFNSGKEEIASLMDYIDSIGVSFSKSKALDFGCGVGRLTQALSGYFTECWGVDIAPSMIALAKRYNKYGKRCRYFINDADNLSIFPDGTFDFIYSNIVLQHMRPEYSKNYIIDFLRLIRPGGLIVFQVPSQKSDPQNQSATLPLASLGELPSDAFQASLEIMNPPAFIEPGSSRVLSVRVRNDSNINWDTIGESTGRYRVNLGNHWLDESGKVVCYDDGRSPLPRLVSPKEEIEVLLTITAPEISGQYLIEIDLVQEGVAWFRNKGSAVATASAVVRGRYPSVLQKLFHLKNKLISRNSCPSMTPRMEMYGLPREEVERLIINNHGQLIDVKRYDVCGEEWISYRYTASK